MAWAVAQKGLVRIARALVGLGQRISAKLFERSLQGDLGRRLEAFVRHPLQYLTRTLELEWARWFLWLPVAFGAGILVYFALPFEPEPVWVMAGVVAGVGLVLLSRRFLIGFLLSAALLVMALGLAAAKLQTERLQTPMIPQKTAVTLTGILEAVSDRGRKGKRLTIQVLAIEGLPAEQWPKRVRITTRLKTALQASQPAIGSTIKVRCVLRPLPEPVYPGGYDYARHLWFAGIGAVGFAISPLTVTPQADASSSVGETLRLWVQRLRHRMHQQITAAAPGLSGQIASALITGERGGIPEPAYEVLRAAGLAHVLAISGMHMGIITGALFWLLRALLAAIPALALRYPIKKWAAAAAILGGAWYLAVSGSAVSTERAFIMTTVMFLAVILDRPAIALRNVALAALIILILQPHSVLTPGFQMSFAAATALVAFYEFVVGHFDRSQSSVAKTQRGANPGRLMSWLRWAGLYLGGVMATTLVASIAVAPFAAWHFHEFESYALAGNLLAMPVVSTLVMPMALLTMLALPLGLETIPLWGMTAGIELVLKIASWVAGWPAASIGIATMPVLAISLMALGGIWLCLWQQNWRFLGLPAVAAGMAIIPFKPQPSVLVARDGKVVAVRGEDAKLTLLGARSVNFSARNWFEADGDRDFRPPLSRTRSQRCDSSGCIAKSHGQLIAFSQVPSALREDCEQADIVIARFAIRQPCAAAIKIDRLDLWAKGAHAIYLAKNGVLIRTVAEMRGRRPWVLPRVLKRHRGPDSMLFQQSFNPQTERSVNGWTVKPAKKTR